MIGIYHAIEVTSAVLFLHPSLLGAVVIKARESTQEDWWRGVWQSALVLSVP